MADVRPFRGVLYDVGRIGDIASVLSPPYDIIDPALQDALYGRSPWNFVRIDLGRSEPGDASRDELYARSRDTFRTWLDEKVLVADDTPCFYPVKQTFTVRMGGADVRRVRYGFFGAFGVAPYGPETILPHEKTQSGPKEDRFRLAMACRAHFSAIFSMYGDPSRLVESLFARDAFGSPVFSYTDHDGVDTALYRSADPVVNAQITGLFDGRGAYIADGHHRYEMSLRIHRELAAAGDTGGHGHTLMYFACMEDEGMLVLPTYRLVRPEVAVDEAGLRAFLERYFTVSAHDHGDYARLVAEVAHGRDRTTMLFVTRSGLLLARLGDPAGIAGFFPAGMPEAQRRLDVVILQQVVFDGHLGITADDLAAQKKVSYTKDADDALAAVTGGRASLAAIMNAPGTADVARISDIGGTMPQKSTYFYPKVPSGAVIYDFDRP